jgi:hypothetical protein
MKPYKIPPGYYFWNDFAIQTYTFCSNFNTTKNNQIKRITDGLSLKEMRFTPIYCLKKQLIEEIKLTDVREKTGVLVDLKVAIPSLVLFLPENTIKSPMNEGAFIKYIVVHHYEINNEVYKTGILWFSIDSSDEFLIGTRNVRYDGITKCNEVQGNEYVKKNFFDIQNLILQSLMILQTYPELSEEVLPSEVFKEGSKHNTSSHRLPRWLGGGRVRRNYSNETSPTGITVAPHIRSGHWRSQPYGKQNQLRKMIWLRPVWVNYALKLQIEQTEQTEQTEQLVLTRG